MAARKTSAKTTRKTARPARKRAPKSTNAQEPDALAPGGQIEAIGSGGAPHEELPTLSRFVVRAGIAAWSIVGVLLVFAAVLFLLRQLSPVFPPLIFGAVVVLLLEPAVSVLVRRGVRRSLAVSFVYVVAVAVVVGAGFVAIPAMVHQGQQFARDLPKLLENGGSLAASGLRKLNQGAAGARLKDAVSSYLGTNAGSLPQQVSRFASIGLRLANFAANALIGFVLGFYGLLALPRMRVTFGRVVPAERRAVLAPLGARVRAVFTGFLRARLIVSAAVGALAILGLWIVGMPFWLILGLIVGVANLVPMLGSALGGIPVLLVALLAKPPIYLLIAFAVLVVAHAVDGYILSPIVLRETTDLHPIVVLIAVLVGGALLGLWGILAAVPVAGGIQVLVLEFVRRRRLAGEAAEAAAASA